MKLSEIDKHKFITVVEPRNGILKSQYGVITYQEWCEHEVKRLGGFATFVVDGNLCAIVDGRAEQ